MMGRHLELPGPPGKIVSLVPSQTELLYDLGLGERIVGVTKFCIYPAHARREARVVGGTKQIHFDRVAALQPDLIIGNKEENEESMIRTLALDYPVWMSDIFHLEDALSMIAELGRITGTTEAARTLSHSIASSFNTLRPPHGPAPRVAYLIWKDPWMGVGRDTFIDAMLRQAGFVNALSDYTRYPILDPSKLADARPDWILLSSEPYPFRKKHQEALQSLLPGVRALLVNGEYFSWYGSRLLKAPGYFQALRLQMAPP